jgi:hypothetical protein
MKIELIEYNQLQNSTQEIIKTEFVEYIRIEPSSNNNYGRGGNFIQYDFRIFFSPEIVIKTNHKIKYSGQEYSIKNISAMLDANNELNHIEVLI